MISSMFWVEVIAQKSSSSQRICAASMAAWIFLNSREMACLMRAWRSRIT